MTVKMHISHLLLLLLSVHIPTVYSQLSDQCPINGGSCAIPTRTPIPLSDTHSLHLTPPSTTPLHLKSRLLLSNITTSYFSDSRHHSTPDEFFNHPRHFLATPADLRPYVHPRIVVGPTEWNRIIAEYADSRYFNIKGTWSKYFMDQTRRLSVNSQLVDDLEFLYTSNALSVYTALPYGHPSYPIYRQSLYRLARNITRSAPHTHDCLLLCALWASVARLRWTRHENDYQTPQAHQRCIHATVAWATILLAHRSYHCNPHCITAGTDRKDKVYMWDTKRSWGLDVDWASGGTGLALAYDVLYNDMTPSQRRTVRSAIALVVMKRFAWGTASQSTAHSPNVMEHPHRAFSNWAAYNGHLYITNLAIEGEDDYDDYTISAFQHEGVQKVGFNRDLHIRYTALLEAFFSHSIYPDGSTFEDGYTYFTALREGSIALVAAERRGSSILTTPRFRNTIHNAAQMMEPWHCGMLVGHASGGGNVYNSYIALFKYAYPNGPLPAMLWRQRFGPSYENFKPCRVSWTQAALQFAFLGSEHTSVSDSPETLPENVRDLFPLSYYSPRRGLLIARASIDEVATYVHFDCRPDAFFPGHDNADRGVFTFSALRRTWIDDLDWRSNENSEKHSLLHVDGLAQGLKAPSCHPLRAEHNNGVIISAGDLTYAYNYQWDTGANRQKSFRELFRTYDINGHENKTWIHFTERETNTPYDLGWPTDDDATDIGLQKTTRLHGEANVGFFGLWYWRRPYRQPPLQKMVRSVAIVQSGPHEDDYGILIVVDSVQAAVGDHTFESYLILQSEIIVDEEASHCVSNFCLIVLMHESGGDDRVDIHVRTLEEGVSYRFERFDVETERRAGRRGKPRIVITSIADTVEEIWMVLHAHRGKRHNMAVRMLDPDELEEDEDDSGNDDEDLGDDDANDSSRNSTNGERENNGIGKNGVLQISGEFYHKFFTVRREDNSVMETSPTGEILHISTSAGDTPTPTPKAKWSMPPMRTYTLTTWRKRRLYEHQFEEDHRVFYSKTTRVAQAVFKFYAVSSRGKTYTTDVLSTCFWGSNVEVDINVYDCADEFAEEGNAYLERGCALVQKSEGTVKEHERCKSYKGGYGHGLQRRVEMSLRRGREYYAVVSIDYVPGRMRRLILRHETGSQAVAGSEATATPRPAPRFSKHPMAVRKLPFASSTTFHRHDFEDDAEQFFTNVEGGYLQLTFAVSGHGDDDDDEMEDFFSTCGWQTNVEVDLRVYDCGPAGDEWDESYRQRRCEMIELNGVHDRCKGFRTTVRTALEADRSFLLVVTVLRWEEDRNGMKKEVVALQHNVVRG